MTVLELIEKLKQHDENMIIAISDWEGNLEDVEEDFLIIDAFKIGSHYYEANPNASHDKIIKLLCI